MNDREKEMAEEIDRAEQEDEEGRDVGYVRPRPPRAPSQVYSIRIPVECLEELRGIAEGRGLQPSSLMRKWVLERLELERASSSAEPTQTIVIVGAEVVHRAKTGRKDLLDEIDEVLATSGVVGQRIVS